VAANELSPFVAWETFYVIIGSSAAALTGLQFVVVVLGAEARSIGRLALGAVGAAGIVYTAVVIRRALRQKRYVPVLEDWLWHCTFPLIAYVTLLVAALLLRRDPPRCLLVIGATALLLLFIGIHNAWDAVTYIATQQPQHREGPPDQK